MGLIAKSSHPHRLLENALGLKPLETLSKALELAIGPKYTESIVYRFRNRLPAYGRYAPPRSAGVAGIFMRDRGFVD